MLRRIMCSYSFPSSVQEKLEMESSSSPSWMLPLRYRCGSGKSCSQLTVEELSSFVRQLYNLPCSLPQAPLLKVGCGGGVIGLTLASKFQQ